MDCLEQLCQLLTRTAESKKCFGEWIRQLCLVSRKRAKLLFLLKWPTIRDLIFFFIYECKHWWLCLRFIEYFCSREHYILFSYLAFFFTNTQSLYIIDTSDPNPGLYTVSSSFISNYKNKYSSVALFNGYFYIGGVDSQLSQVTILDSNLQILSAGTLMSISPL